MPVKLNKKRLLDIFYRHYPVEYNELWRPNMSTDGMLADVEAYHPVEYADALQLYYQGR